MDCWLIFQPHRFFVITRGGTHWDRLGVEVKLLHRKVELEVFGKSGTSF